MLLIYSLGSNTSKVRDIVDSLEQIPDIVSVYVRNTSALKKVLHVVVPENYPPNDILRLGSIIGTMENMQLFV